MLRTVFVFAILQATPLAGQQPRIAARDVALTSLSRTMAHQGRPVVAKRWTDRLGENTLVLTQTGKRRGGACQYGEEVCSDAEVYAYHYVTRGATTSLLWRTTDFMRGCSFDLYAGYVPESVAITDLDGDGVAESSFMYLLACRSDVSPATLKLIMHEGAQKYAARGTSRPRGAPEGGAMRLDDAFARAPRSFAAFAGEQWRRFRSHDTFQQF
ncbi:MAG: hypothetical protein ICV87_05705 [Gemmatimonadetes bacterium]|nr:hypothetical protein [Gemmatimonadota bacterium]